MSLLDKYQSQENTPVATPTAPAKPKSLLDKYPAPVQEPGFVQSVAQGIASGPLQLASNIRGIGEGIKNLGTAYNQYKAETGKSGVGNVLSDIKANAPTINKTLESYTPTKYNYDYGYLGKSSNITTPKEALGTAANIASLYTGGGTATGIYNTLGKGFLGKTLPVAKDIAKNVIAPGAATGGLGLGGEALQQGKSYTEAGKEFVKGAAIGAGTSLVLGPVASKGFQVLKNTVAPSADVISSKIDDSIRNVYKGTTMDLAKQNESAFKVKKGLDLLSQEAKNLKIVDDKAPIGVTKDMPTKAFNIKKATPNEFVSAVTEMGNKIAGIAREAAQKAKETGLKIDVTEARRKIDNAVNAGDIPQATGLRLQKQLDSLNGDPLSVHDWVQGINSKYGSRYEKGTIDDMATSKIADDIASTLRSKLDNIVDRSGYAEAFGNNQELKRLMVTAAKKANKQVEWGDITSDAGLDAAFAILTGNPAYMARTFGTTLLKGMFNRMRNQSQFKSIKKAAVLSGKVEGKAKLPSKDVKIDMTLKRLPAPSYIPAKAPKVKDASGIKVTNTNADPRTMSTTKLLPAPKKSTTPIKAGGTNVMGQKVSTEGKILSPKSEIKVSNADIDPRTSLKDEFGNEIMTDVNAGDATVQKFLKAKALVDDAKATKADLTKQINELRDGTPFGKPENLREYRQQIYGGYENEVRNLVTLDSRFSGKGGLSYILNKTYKYGEKRPDIVKNYDSLAEELGYNGKNGDAIDYLVDIIEKYRIDTKRARDTRRWIGELKSKLKDTNRFISEETYQKAKKSFEEKMTSINSGVRVDALYELSQMAAYHIENGVRDAAELAVKLGTAVKDYTKEQLDDLFNRGKLTLEAKKYNSAEEFVNSSTKLTYKNLQENPYSIKAYGKDFNEPVEYHRAGIIKKNGDIWLTDNPAGASQYSSAGGGTKTGSYIVQSKNPLIIDTAGGKYANGNIDISKILTPDELKQGYTNNPTLKQKFIDYAKNNGYDAVQFADSFPDGEGGMRSLVVWDKSAIKTKSQLTDIWNNSQKSKTTLPKASDKYTRNPKGQFAKVDTPKDLMALHNIHESNLEKVFSSGSIPAPSIAITKKNIEFNDFGEITLIGNPKLIDPKKAKVNTFGGDTYTVRVPSPEYNLAKSASEIENIVSKYGLNKNDIDMIKYKDIDKMRFIDKYSSIIPEVEKVADEIYSKPFLTMKNAKPTGELKELVKDKEIAEIYNRTNDIDDFWAEITNTEGAYYKLEALAKSKGMDDYYELYDVLVPQFETNVPYNADNIVKHMEQSVQQKGGGLRGTEKAWGTTAGPHVYGFKKFKSIQDIKDSSNKLVSKEMAAKLADQREYALSSFVGDYRDKFSSENLYDNIEYAYEEVIKNNKYDNIPFIKKEFGITDSKFAEELGRKIKDTYFEVPTQYFESKVLRKVLLDEFDGAVIPKNTSKETIKKLEEAGLKVVLYDGTAKDRLSKIAKFTGSAFGLMVIYDGNDK